MSVEENKKIARTYFDHKPDDVELILTADFIGHTNAMTWNRDSHKETWLTFQSKLKDTIHQQIAEGDWVATWFTRSGTFENKSVKWDFMSFTRFVGGKIAQVWEIADSKQFEQ